MLNLPYRNIYKLLQVKRAEEPHKINGKAFSHSSGRRGDCMMRAERAKVR